MQQELISATVIRSLDAPLKCLKSVAVDLGSLGGSKAEEMAPIVSFDRQLDRQTVTTCCLLLSSVSNRLATI